MSIEIVAERLGISTAELFANAEEQFPDPWAPNPALNHIRWRKWGEAFVPDSVRRFLGERG